MFSQWLTKRVSSGSTTQRAVETHFLKVGFQTVSGYLFNWHEISATYGVCDCLQNGWLMKMLCLTSPGYQGRRNWWVSFTPYACDLLSNIDLCVIVWLLILNSNSENENNS